MEIIKFSPDKKSDENGSKLQKKQLMQLKQVFIVLSIDFYMP